MQIHGAKTINCKKPAVHVCRKAMSSKTMQNNFKLESLKNNPLDKKVLNYFYVMKSEWKITLPTEKSYFFREDTKKVCRPAGRWRGHQFGLMFVQHLQPLRLQGFDAQWF